MKIVICGSMSASKEMVAAEQQLLSLSHQVVLPEFTHEYAAMDTFARVHSESTRNKIENDLIRGHYHSIESGDAVLIINVERHGIAGYIGGNSFLEMGFAHVLRKPIYLLQPIPEMGYRDEIEAMRPIVINGDFTKIMNDL